MWPMGKEFNPYDLNDVAEIMEMFPDPNRVVGSVNVGRPNPYDLNHVALINRKGGHEGRQIDRQRPDPKHNRGLLKVD